MNGKVVFDSTSIIKFLDKEPGFIDLSPIMENDACFVSIITKMETLGWPEITSEDEARINDFLSRVIIIPITETLLHFGFAELQTTGSKPGKQKNLQLNCSHGTHSDNVNAAVLPV